MLKKKKVLIFISIAVTSFLIGTMLNFTGASNSGNPWDRVWTAISELQSEIESLEARVSALESPTEIKIVAYPTTDIYLRYHGLSIDEPLPDEWWLHGYEFEETGRQFTYVKSVPLEYGSHYVVYASSGYVYALDLAWHARIYINNVLMAEGEVGRDSPLKAYFEVGD